MAASGGAASVTSSSAVSPAAQAQRPAAEAGASKAVDTSSDDPLAAIMNQTIFGGRICGNLLLFCSLQTMLFCQQDISLVHKIIFPHCLGDSMNTMFIQVNTDSYLSSENSGMVGINGSQEQGFCKEEDGGMITDEGAFMSEDDDLNVSYTCDICNKSIKGKVMLQVNTALK